MIGYREMTPEDRPFVASSFIRSFRKSPYVGLIPAQLYQPVYGAIVDGILDRSRTMVSFNHENQKQTFGFVTFDPDVLHYVYVKRPFRNMGIAGRLLTQAGFSRDTRFRYTFLTKQGKEIARKYEEAKHDPIYIRLHWKGDSSKVRTLCEPREGRGATGREVRDQG